MNNFLKILIGMLPGVDDFIGYFFNKEKSALAPWTLRLKRAASLIAITLLILGFVGALAVPLPGVAPLYAITAAGVLKAFGITLGFAAAARATGAFVGAWVDRLHLIKRMGDDKVAIKKSINPFRFAFTIGLFGETGAPVIKSFFESFFKKANPPKESIKLSTIKKQPNPEDNLDLQEEKPYIPGSQGVILAAASIKKPQDNSKDNEQEYSDLEEDNEPEYLDLEDSLDKEESPGTDSKPGNN